MPVVEKLKLIEKKGIFRERALWMLTFAVGEWKELI